MHATYIKLTITALNDTGVHAASEKMTSWGFDLLCPHSSDICNCACQSWGYTSGECQGLGNSQCWCFYFGK